MTTDRPKVLLSYGTADTREFVAWLKPQLEAAGFAVWKDAERIRAGWPWGDEIRDAIDESAAVLAVLSPHAVRAGGVCYNEYIHAKYFAGKPIVPLLAVRCTPPFVLNDLHYLDFTDPAKHAGELPRLIEHLNDAIRTRRSKARTGFLDEVPTFNFAFQMRKREGFVGREWLFRLVNDWRREATGKRAAVITGEPGIGKSAIVAELAARSPEFGIVAVHFADAAYSDLLDAGGFVQSVARQLAAVFPDYAVLAAEPGTLLKLKNAPTQPAEALRDGVLMPLSKLKPPDGGPYLILVDSMDEALTTSGAATIPDLLSGLLDHFPPWLKVLTTSRPEPEVMAKLKRLQETQLKADLGDNRADVRTYIAGRTGEPEVSAKLGAVEPVTFISQLDTAAAGNFLYAAEVFRAVREGDLDPADQGDIPPGLEGLYHRFFERRFPNREAQYPDARAVLELLAAAEAPLPEVMLADATGFHRVDRLNPTLRRLSQFTRADGGGYRVYHRSLADWLATNHAFQIDTARGHGRLADLGWREFEAGVASMGEYALLYLPTHLKQSGRAEKYEMLMTDGYYLNWMSDYFASHGSLGRKLIFFTQALVLHTRRAISEVNNSGWQLQLSIILDRVGNVRAQLGNLAGALDSYQQGLDIRQVLALSDASNSRWQRNLSVSQNRIGDVRAGQRDLAEALTSYLRGLDFSAKLASSDASNSGWQRDLSVSYEKIGDVRVGQGDLAGALARYEQAFDIRERLVSLDPTNSVWQRDVAVSYSKIATVAEKANDPQASEWWRKCVAVFERMIHAGLHVSPQDLGYLEQLQAKLGGKPRGGSPGTASGWKK